MTKFDIDILRSHETPFYFYDLDLLRKTLAEVKRCAFDGNEQGGRYHVHYALKACHTPEVMQTIFDAGLGADCVSGGEVRAAIEAGVSPDRIVFAGVAKADWEIRYALQHDIACLNVESIEELENIDLIAAGMGVVARVCLRINPNINPHTHKKITTGLSINKFGISLDDMMGAVMRCQELTHISFEGLHFHIGSQLTDFSPFRSLCVRISQLVHQIEECGISVRHINVGGGLGVSYEHPNYYCMPDFEGYFKVFRTALALREDQHLHFELGRSVVAQCGSLITRVLYVKHTSQKEFVMVDAGMTDLIRPALYDALHKIENLTALHEGRTERGRYDVVGPICESSDVFAEDYELPLCLRGDIIAIRTAGAYGEVMASCYNLRRLPGHIVSDGK
ncbi:MAG: diaminopimelate decarboxylase [Paludibacteraceae bacterium]|nr:diaminopimelate decarboxylase [Paludibacteraceae bacterium]